MDEIAFPLKLEELLQADSGFQVVSELSLCELSDDEIKGHFEGDTSCPHFVFPNIHTDPLFRRQTWRV